MIEVLRAKLHGIHVTGCDLDYHGSVTLDPQICERAGMKVIIIDSISHCWDYLLDFHANLQGNSFANWAKVTPRQNAFIQRILNSSCHVICTMRSKQEYVLNERNGKMIPEKVGLKAVQRDNVDYEFTIVFDINMKHYASVSKDRTKLFDGKAEFLLSEQVGTLVSGKKS